MPLRVTIWAIGAVESLRDKEVWRPQDSGGEGAAAAAVIERQLNGFMGSRAGVGTPAGRQSAQTHH